MPDIIFHETVGQGITCFADVMLRFICFALFVLFLLLFYFCFLGWYFYLTWYEKGGISFPPKGVGKAEIRTD